MSDLLFAITLGTALGAGLIAGAFFAFSTFVMKALAQQPAASGIATMQAINVTVFNPLFMLAFLGTAATSAVLAVVGVLEWNEAYGPYLLTGGLLYFAGTFLVTMIFNVPLNDALEKSDAASTGGASLWGRFLVTWTNWNHVRTLAALAALAAYAVALSQ